MLKNGKRIRHPRRFSEDFKLKLVEEYEKGVHSVPEMEKIYEIPNSCIYSWIYQYSTYNKKSIKVVEMKDSQMQKFKDMEARIKELEQAVGRKQMTIDFLAKMIDLAEEEYKIDIKKSSNTPPSGGLDKTKEK